MGTREYLGESDMGTAQFSIWVNNVGVILLVLLFLATEGGHSHFHIPCKSACAPSLFASSPFHDCIFDLLRHGCTCINVSIKALQDHRRRFLFVLLSCKQTVLLSLEYFHATCWISTLIQRTLTLFISALGP